MITRRHIRVKVLQAVYAYFHDLRATDDTSLQKQEKFLAYSIDQMHSLYLLMLNLLTEIQGQAERYMVKSQKKFLATEEDKKPNRKFVDNAVLKQLANSPVLTEALKKRTLNNWQEDNEYVQLLFKELRQSDLYRQYLESGTSGYEEDRKFVIAFFKEIVAPNEKLYDYLENQRLTWLDDFPIVNTALVKMLEHLKPGSNRIVPPLYKNDDDRDFGLQLFRKVVLHNESLENEVSDNTPNWDKERIAELDFIMLKMGLTEFLHFPTIPVKVSINEYLEIAKEYSTPKSSFFINGLLDKKSKAYQAEDKLNKMGRGLR